MRKVCPACKGTGIQVIVISQEQRIATLQYEMVNVRKPVPCRFCNRTGAVNEDNTPATAGHSNEGE